MAEIDSLEIKLQSNIQAVTKDLEQLIGKITLTSKAIASFGNNKALEQLNREAKGVADGMKQAASASGAMKNVSSAASAAQKPMEELQKTVGETAKELYRQFKNFTPKIDFSQSTAALQKQATDYQRYLISAHNELKSIMSSSTAYKQTSGMERYIKRIQEAKNGIKAINAYLDKMSSKPVQSFSIDSQETVDSAQEIETRIASIKQSIESLQALPKGMITQGLFDAFKNDLAWIQENAPQEVNVINDLSSALQNLKIIGNNSGGGVRSLDELKKRADDLANNIQLVKSLMQDLQNQRKDISINIKDTYKQNLDELKSNLEEIKNVYNVEYTPKVNIDNAKNKIQEFQDALDSIRPEEFTGNFFEMEKYVDGLNQRLDSLTKRFDKLSSLGVSPDTQRLHDLQYEIESVVVTLNKYEAELDKARKAGQLDIKIPSIDSQINRVQGSFNKLQNTMRGAKVVIPTDSLKKVEAEIERVKKKYDQTVESINRKAQTVQFYGTSTDYKNKMIELEALRNKYQELINKQSQLSKIGGGGLTFNAKGFTDGVKNLQKALAPVEKTLQRVNKFINSFAKKIASIVSPMKKASKATDGFGKSLSMNFRTILKYGFGIRSLFVLFNRLRAAITDGMRNLVQYSQTTNQSLSMLKASLNQTKNSLAAAFAPILNAIAPAVNYLIQLLIKAINVINQFFAAITGGSNWIRAKYVYEDVAAGISGVGSSAEDAAKKIKGSLQPFDALNNLTTQENADAGGGGGGSILPEDMFETLPINDKIKEFADKVKDILKRLFAPLKKAWDREGKFVMDSWEKALKNVWALIKDIGRDFLRVWEQDATVDVLANILHIIGDIGLVVSNLAERFREAWNENEVGFHIFEKIRDIIGIIVQHIRNAADATVEWSAQLDFYPLLDAFDRFLESIKPVVDAVYGVMEDFYTQVLLPLGKWTLEKGLPELLQVFIDFNNKVDWEGLRQSLSELWEHLEPFSETVGEGLILFIERVSDALADFLNSQEFKDFLKSVEDWMDSVTPEDVADTLENVAKAVVGIKLALAGWPAIKGFLSFVGGVAKLVSYARQAKKLKELSDAIKGMSKAGGAAKTAGGAGGLFGGIASAWGSLGGLPGILTTDLGTILGAGTAAEIGVTIGVGILGGIAGAFAGGEIGKLLDNYILAPLFDFDEELSEQYKNFKWFGEDGFFSELKSSITDGSWKDALSMWGNDIVDGLEQITADTSGFSLIDWDSIKEKAVSAWETIKTTLQEKWETIKLSAQEKFEGIKTTLAEIWENIKSKVTEVWETIKTTLSWENIKESAIETWETIKSTLSEKWESMKVKVQEVWDSIKEKISTVWEEVKSNTVEKWETVKTSISTAIDSAKDKVKSAIDKIKGFFNFEWKLPEIKLPKMPHFSITGDFSFNPPRVPKINVSWYANGGLFTRPTIAGFGEAGDEVALPLTNPQVMSKISESILDNYNKDSTTGNNSAQEILLLQEQNQLLARQNELLTSLASKEFGITEEQIGQAAQNWAFSFQKRTGDSAYSF